MQRAIRKIKFPGAQREANKRSKRKFRLAAIKLLGSKCIRCGFTDLRALQIDHVKGDGGDERRRLGRNGHQINKRVLAVNGEGYQLLCANCNWIKRTENEEWRTYESRN